MFCCLYSQFVLDLDVFGGNDSDDMLPLFYKQMARELAPKLTVIFRNLAKGSSFLAFWRLADAISVANASPSSEFEDYRPISITPFLTKCLRRS